MLAWIAIILGAIVLDQLTKYLTVFYLKPIDTLPLIEDVLHLTYVENPGAAFGMMKDSRWIFMTVSTVAIVGILAYLFIKRPTSRIECLSLAFIVGGGIGNMIDRFLLGYVIDMIDFRLINFAVFNVADSFVCVGAGIMMVWLLYSIVLEVRAEKARAQDALEEPNDEEDIVDDLLEYETDETEGPAEPEVIPAEAAEPETDPAEDAGSEPSPVEPTDPSPDGETAHD